MTQEDIPQFPEEHTHNMIDFIIEHETNGDVKNISKILNSKQEVKE